MRGFCVVACATTVAALAAAASVQGASQIQGEDARFGDRDTRTARVAPTAEQRRLARRAGVRATWNRFGTAQTLSVTQGSVATGLATKPVAAAREWIADNRGLLGIGSSRLELVSSNPIGAGRAVLLRQRFGSLPAGRDGMIVVGVRDGRIAYVSSSLAPGTALSGTRRLGAAAAIRAAAADARLRPDALVGKPELVAVPTPQRGNRRAWKVSLLANGAEPRAVSTFVDAETGKILIRDSVVDHLADNPRWSVFPASPPLTYASTDTRVRWCWTAATGCNQLVANPASPDPWDVNARTKAPTLTTRGNNAIAVHNWTNNDPFTVGKETATRRPDREYAYAWTNQWHDQRCNPSTTFTSPQRNDIDAARANLFAMHNRMHDFAYRLGFTETAWNMQEFNYGKGGAEDDFEQGNAQAGGIGEDDVNQRDNANQITFEDGVAPITNMYLWQPIAAAFYAPCVDGDYDMSVIAHEYTHAISNRMAAGPDDGLSGPQAGAMGESWSDLDAVEYLLENGYVPTAGENPFAVGPYVTGDHRAGIRNYGMNGSPLNYSDVGYDFACNTQCPPLTQVHADGEIWSATNYDIRQAFVARYGAGNAALQAACARGDVAVTSCPGNRRWIQLVYDAWLLMPTGTVSMVDARDAMLAADQLRFNGVNQDILWNAFAKRGLGQGAVSNGTGDADPVPSFESPFADEATVRFRPPETVPVGPRSSSSAATRLASRRSPTRTPERRSATRSGWCRAPMSWWRAATGSAPRDSR